MHFALERSGKSGAAWIQIFVAPGPIHPGSLGLIGQPGECLCWTRSGESRELWEWSDRIPLNPGDLACTDFMAGWVLIHREASPVVSADELAHYFVQ